MKTVKVLGMGCVKCTKTAALIEEVAKEQHISVELSKETNPEVIMGYGVMSTPAVVIDGTVVHSGSIPGKAKVEAWLKD